MVASLTASRSRIVPHTSITRCLCDAGCSPLSAPPIMGDSSAPHHAPHAALPYGRPRQDSLPRRRSPCSSPPTRAPPGSARTARGPRMTRRAPGAAQERPGATVMAGGGVSPPTPPRSGPTGHRRSTKWSAASASTASASRARSRAWAWAVDVTRGWGPNARSNAATWYTCKGLPPRRWCAAYPWTTSRASAWIFHVYRRSGLLQPAACGSASHAASGRRHPMAHTRWAVVVRRRAAWRSRHQCNPGDPPPHGVAPPPQCPGQSAHGDGS